GTDQDIRQLLIGITPGVDNFRRGDFLAQHFGNGGQQAAADNRVVLGENLQGNVFVDDFGEQVTQLLQLVDVAGVHQQTVGQRLWLSTACLVGRVEQGPHLRVFRQ